MHVTQGDLQTITHCCSICKDDKQSRILFFFLQATTKLTWPVLTSLRSVLWGVKRNSTTGNEGIVLKEIPQREEDHINMPNTECLIPTWTTEPYWIHAVLQAYSAIIGALALNGHEWRSFFLTDTLNLLVRPQLHLPVLCQCHQGINGEASSSSTEKALGLINGA